MSAQPRLLCLYQLDTRWRVPALLSTHSFQEEGSQCTDTYVRFLTHRWWGVGISKCFLGLLDQLATNLLLYILLCLGYIQSKLLLRLPLETCCSVILLL